MPVAKTAYANSVPLQKAGNLYNIGKEKYRF
jgi:hypothetical protein